MACKSLVTLAAALIGLLSLPAQADTFASNGKRPSDTILSCSVSLENLQAAYRTGALSVEQAVKWYATRIATYDRTGPRLEAIAFPDIDRSLSNARRLDALSGPAKRKLPLFGMPIIVKDMIDVADLPTAFGTRLLAKSVAQRDAPAVARLRSAGAIILGKSTMTGDSQPFLPGYSAQGLTVNPFDRDRDPQGSSTGSAVAVAAGLAMAGLGEETTDSIRGVADAVGLASIRATRGRVPMEGIYPLSRNMDVIGPLTQYVADAARVIDVMTDCKAGRTSCVAVGKTPLALKGLKLGVPASYAGRNAKLRSIRFSDRTLASFDLALDELRALGAVIVPVDRPSASPYDYLSLPTDPDYQGLDIPDWKSPAFKAQDDHATTLTIDKYFRDFGSGKYRSIDAVIDAMREPPALTATSTGAGDVLTAQYFDTLRRSGQTAGQDAQLTRFDQIREKLYVRDMVEIARKFKLDAFVFPTAFRPPLSVVEGMRDKQFGGDNVFAAAPIDYGVPAVTVPMPPIAADIPATLTFMGLRNDDARVVAIADAYERATNHRIHPEAFCRSEPKPE